MSCVMLGIERLYSLVNFISLSLVGLRPQQLDSMCGRSSTVVAQVGDRRQNPFLLFDQWLQKISVLYLPDKNSAWTRALVTS